jgi:hypothetical protein
MKIEEILDYKLKKLLGANAIKVNEADKKFVLAQAKTKIQAYCHRRDMPKGIYYIWADIAIEILKNVDGSLFKKDITTEEELAKRVTSIKTGDTNISLDTGGYSDKIDTGYDTNNVDDIAIFGTFAKQLQVFRKFAAGCGDGLDGI